MTGPTEDELRAWRAFLRAHANLIRTLELELITEQGVSLAAYDVLVHLAEAPDRRLRMAELAEAVLLSRSGVTRHVDRLERQGLVTRERVLDDGRGVVATLTPKGLATLRTAATTHMAGIATHFATHLDQADLHHLTTICTKLADAKPPPTPTPPRTRRSPNGCPLLPASPSQNRDQT